MASTAAREFWRLRRILLATSLFLCAIKALAQTPSPAPPGVNFERVLVIGTKDAPPFSMKDDRGEWTGLSIDLWKHIAEELHLRYRFKETTLQGLSMRQPLGSWTVPLPHSRSRTSARKLSTLLNRITPPGSGSPLRSIASSTGGAYFVA